MEYAPCLKRKKHAKVGDKAKVSGRERYDKPQLRAQSESEKRMRKSKKKVEVATAPLSDTSASHDTQNESENEESYDSSEDEEDKGSEERPSNEGEQTESLVTSGDEVRSKSRKSTPTHIYMEESIDENVHGDADQSDPDGRDRHQSEQKVKRKRRKYSKSSMSPTARASSSPSTSQEEKPTQREKKKKTKKENSNVKSNQEAENLPYASGTDDSSPECDMSKSSESQGEAKGLRKVFEGFFGKLCVAIVNPVGIAAELQSKGLLSKSIMKDIIMSLESQQAKAISLVDKLDKKIKSHPDCLFQFIKVLLENESLQETGREMLREAGM